MKMDSIGLDENELDEDSRGADSICEVIGCGANWTEWWINYLTTNSNKLNHFIFTLISNDISFGTEILGHVFLALKKSSRNQTVPYLCHKISIHVVHRNEGFGHQPPRIPPTLSFFFCSYVTLRVPPLHLGNQVWYHRSAGVKTTGKNSE